MFQVEKIEGNCWDFINKGKGFINKGKGFINKGKGFISSNS